MNPDLYELHELIDLLEEIKNEGQGTMSLPKAIYCLAKEMEELKFYLQCFHDLIPIKYRKLHPQEGENPFFSLNDISHQINIPEERRKAKERMEKLLNKSKLQSEEGSLSDS